MSGLQSELRAVRLLPVLTVDAVEAAVPLADALTAAGLTVLEITLRTPAALEVVRAIRRERPGLTVGVGTALEPQDFRRAVDAGAAFVVSPGQTPDLLKAAAGAAVPLLPGVATGSEVMAVRAAGIRFAKFFPAETSGGAAALKAFAGPFADMRFCPTGGLDAAKAPSYLALPNVVCVGGAWMAPAAAVKAGDWAAVESAARAAVAALPAT